MQVAKEILYLGKDRIASLLHWGSTDHSWLKRLPLIISWCCKSRAELALISASLPV